MTTTGLVEPETVAVAGDAQAPAPHPPEIDAGTAWERFLRDRAREAGCRTLRRWRDEEGL
jgi:hypothetical protein